MEFQFHPASRRGYVRSLLLDERGERVAVALAGLACLAALSLWFTAPTFVRRVGRRERSVAIAEESAAVARQRRSLETRAASVRNRALDLGDLLSRAAFLSDAQAGRWPRSLNPETGVLAGSGPEAIVNGLARYLSGLERGLALLEELDAADPSLPGRTPSILPLATDLVEPSAVFGPRVSPWTGAEEFFAGLDLAAPVGSAVIAPAAGTVVFAGRVAASASSRLWRFGNLVVLSHGSAGATLYGHLAKIDVRRGDRVQRGSRIGSVGATGWTMSPTLHYEYWRYGGGGLSPTDPRFAVLDRRLGGHDASLERMRATSAPGPKEPLPGMGRVR